MVGACLATRRIGGETYIVMATELFFFDFFGGLLISPRARTHSFTHSLTHAGREFGGRFLRVDHTTLWGFFVDTGCRVVTC
jgi:hypothetical protein